VTKQVVLIDRFTGLDFKNEKVHHVKVTTFYLDRSIKIPVYRLVIKHLPEATGDPEIKRKLRAIWYGLEHWLN